MAIEWTPEDKAAALREYAAGTPMKDICARFGKTKEAIYGIASAAGVGRPNGYTWTVERHEASWVRIRAALVGSEGMTVHEICIATGVPGATVHNALHRHPTEVGIVRKAKTRAKPAPVWKLLDETVEPLARVTTEFAGNPFAVAAGLVEPLQTVTGRVYRQDMGGCESELAA